MSPGRFLAGVGVVVWSTQNNKYLLLRRATHRDFGGQSWECVTGRVDQGESFERALIREVEEEIGVRIQIEFLLGTTHFYRGEPSTLTELVGVLYAGTIENPDDIKVSSEHSEYRWVTIQEAKQILPPKHWLHPVFERVEFLRRQTPDLIRETFQSQGFELADSSRNSLY